MIKTMLILALGCTTLAGVMLVGVNPNLGLTLSIGSMWVLDNLDKKEEREVDTKKS